MDESADLEADRSDAALSRREFVERAACTAGLAGMAASLPASLLLSQAAKAQAVPLPLPQNLPIDHFVIVMMENRSFDHYFGWMSDVADGVQAQQFPNPQGTQVPTRHASSFGDAQWQGCGHPDPGHGWESGRVQRSTGCRPGTASPRTSSPGPTRLGRASTTPRRPARRDPPAPASPTPTPPAPRAVSGAGRGAASAAGAGARAGSPPSRPRGSESGSSVPLSARLTLRRMVQHRAGEG